MSVILKHVYSTLETPELKYMHLDDSNLLIAVPALFYKGDPRELAIVKRDSVNTTFMLCSSSYATEEISTDIQNKMCEIIEIGDKLIFDYKTGDVVIKNGDRQIKYFELYPNTALKNKDGASEVCGFVYSEGDVDKIGYFYVTSPASLNKLYTLSRIKNKALLFDDGDSCSNFGLTLACNLVYSPISKETIEISTGISNLFVPKSSCILDDLTIFDDLMKLGDRAFKKDEIIEKKKPEDINEIDDSIAWYMRDNIYDNEDDFDVKRKEDGIKILPQNNSAIILFPKRFPLTSVLSHSIVTTLFPVDVDIDIVQKGIKKIVWIDATTLGLYVESFDDLSSETIGLFDDFQIVFKEVK